MERKIKPDSSVAVIKNTVYWESSAEENIREFRRFLALANVFLLLLSINFVLLIAIFSIYSAGVVHP